MNQQVFVDYNNKRSSFRSQLNNEKQKNVM